MGLTKGDKEKAMQMLSDPKSEAHIKLHELMEREIQKKLKPKPFILTIGIWKYLIARLLQIEQPSKPLKIQKKVEKNSSTIIIENYFRIGIQTKPKLLPSFIWNRIGDWLLKGE